MGGLCGHKVDKDHFCFDQTEKLMGLPLAAMLIKKQHHRIRRAARRVSCKTLTNFPIKKYFSKTKSNKKSFYVFKNILCLNTMFFNHTLECFCFSLITYVTDKIHILQMIFYNVNLCTQFFNIRTCISSFSWFKT